jgi:hypothetical protein
VAQYCTAFYNHDLLGYTDAGQSFTRLIKTIDAGKVISIEAGFGRGKTFFRQGWAEQLRAAGEQVIEIDAQRSDHSGDPVVTFIGALMAALPEEKRSIWMKSFATGKSLLWGGAKIAASTVARKAGEESMVALEGWLASDGEKGAIDDMITAFGKDVSKALGAQVSAQLSAEHIRQTEMPAQLNELRKALTQDVETDRVVILIDELDRCHPDYAIALLEAMKLVFDQDGYVFCLMVNADYLENLAAHRFGVIAEGERYLDKFIDIRLKLPDTKDVIGQAVKTLALELPLEIPYGDNKAFSVESAAELAATLAPISGLTMRQIKAVLLRVELAMRCYSHEPLDAPLLVFLGFQDAAGKNRNGENKINEKHLSRANLTPHKHQRWKRSNDPQKLINAFLLEHDNTLLTLERDRYKFPGNQNYNELQKILFLTEHYIPTHRAILDAAYHLQSTDTS